MPADPRPQPNWDLTPFFSAPDGADFRDFRDRLTVDVRALQGRAAELAPPAADRLRDWVALLVDLEQAFSRVRHVSSYLSCMGAADASDERVQRETGALAALRAELEKVFVAVRAALRACDDAAFDALVSDPALAGAGYYLARMRERAARSMDAPLEQLAAELGVDGIAAWSRLYDRITGKLTFEHAPPGAAPRTLPVSMVRTLLEDPDPEVRRAAQRGSAAAWERVAEPLAACLNAIAGTRLTLYRRRGVAHFLEPALFDAGIERATLDAMLAVVRARQDVARRYLRRKAELLGRDRLGFQDRLAPLPRERAGGERIPWEDAKRRILDAFGASYPALRELAARAFDRRWIDHEPRAGKRPGGFCTSSYLLGESRVFLTYNGAPGDVQTVAHELGHAFHNWVMRDLRPFARTYPMTLAETALTFAEQLVTDAALARDGATAQERLAILDHRLLEAAVFLLDIPTRFDFEVALYERRPAGELSVTELSQLMVDAQRASYGDALADGELDPWFWASKLHFYIADVSFYNFPYTFGYLFSLGLFARARAEGPPFLARYEQLLRATASDTAENVAEAALGVDLRGPELWNASIDLIEQDLQQYLALTEAGRPG